MMLKFEIEAYSMAIKLLCIPTYATIDWYAVIQWHKFGVKIEAKP